MHGRPVTQANGSAAFKLTEVRLSEAGTPASNAVACAHELVVERASQIPSAEAIVYGEESVSYAELVSRARGLAGHLVERGVGPDVPVGLCAERSPALVVGMLGALMAGGAYAPLDPAYPH